MNDLERAQCKEWEQMIIDGVPLRNFDPTLMNTYWKIEGFRAEAVEKLRCMYLEWCKN